MKRQGIMQKDREVEGSGNRKWGKGPWVLVEREKTSGSVKKGTDWERLERKQETRYLQKGEQADKPERQVQEVKVKAEQREARGKGKRLSQVSGLKTSMSGEEGMKQSGVEKKTQERIETVKRMAFQC